MTEFRRVTDQSSVAPQIGVADIVRAAQAGFKVIINNRPDGEEPGQLTSAEIEAACTAHNLTYAFIPVVGGPTRAQAAATREALEKGAPALAFCRSGTRSINTWALGEALEDAPKDDLIRAGLAAGYDLRPLLSSIG